MPRCISEHNGILHSALCPYIISHSNGILHSSLHHYVVIQNGILHSTLRHLVIRPKKKAQCINCRSTSGLWSVSARPHGKMYKAGRAGGALADCAHPHVMPRSWPWFLCTSGTLQG